MRAWRSRHGFVAELGRTSNRGVVPSQLEELPAGPFRELMEYLTVDAAGKVQERFIVTSWSIEDELGISVFAVFDGALRQMRVSMFTGDPYRVERTESVVVSDLQPVSPDEHETLLLFHEALRVEIG